MNKVDLEESFDKLKNFMFLNYRGCVLEKIPKGYQLGSKTFADLEAVDRYLDRLFGKWNTNIIKQSNGK